MKWGVTVLVLLSFTACASKKPIGPTIDTNNVKERKYKEAKYETGLEPVTSGSLWPENGRGLFADFRAYRVGDLVTIRIDESSEAAGDSSTNLDRKSSESLGIPNFLGLTTAAAKAYPNLDPKALIEWMGQSNFKGQGGTTRDTHVMGSIAVRVKKVLPNGDLFVEGTKVLLINDEEVHIYVSGSIRAEDIDSSNAVDSSRIADAQIEFSGRGVLTENQQQGWFTKLFAKLRPF
ncbi:MAG TPA: flagellar basal body L-ring protein FlgH [Polyangiales bacterium]|nr:flagellar basal body L-ring protein FlgH [Polyangiales bacterium]